MHSKQSIIRLTNNGDTKDIPVEVSEFDSINEAVKILGEAKALEHINYSYGLLIKVEARRKVRRQ